MGDLRGFFAGRNQRTISTTLTVEQYAFLLERAPVMAWLAHPSRGCIWFNDNWLRFRGRTADEEAGDSWMEGVHPDDVARCRENRRTLFGVRAWYRTRYRLRRRDGVWRWVEEAGVPIHGADGSFEGFLGSCIEPAEMSSWKGLEGVLPTCSWCHRVRDDAGSWVEMERYVAKHAAISFTHGICPECLERQSD